jgi:hypothetical protein
VIDLLRNSKGHIFSGIVLIDPVDFNQMGLHLALNRALETDLPILVVGSELCEWQKGPYGCCPEGLSGNHFYDLLETSSDKFHITASHYGHADIQYPFN